MPTKKPRKRYLHCETMEDIRTASYRNGSIVRIEGLTKNGGKYIFTVKLYNWQFANIAKAMKHRLDMDLLTAQNNLNRFKKESNG